MWGKKLKDQPSLRERKNLESATKTGKVRLQKDNVKKKNIRAGQKKLGGKQKKIPPKPKVKKNLRFKHKNPEAEARRKNMRKRKGKEATADCI